MTTRPADELAAVPEPAWPLVREWIDAARVPVRELEPDPARGLDVLHRLQVTAASTLGALALHSGGLLVDHGWFRLLGGGGAGLPDLATASGLPSDPSDARGAPGSVLVALDAVGGRFAIDGGALGVAQGEVCYFGPDVLRWEGLGGGHTDFVRAVLGGGLADVARPLRWPGWEQEVDALGPDEGVSSYPPPFSAEGRDEASVTRRVVPLHELHAFYDDAAAQLGAGPGT